MVHGFARKTMAAGTILTIFRPSAAGRRTAKPSRPEGVTALKSSSRFWFFFRHKKEQEIIAN
jgi:hypothetical protein